MAPHGHDGIPALTVQALWLCRRQSPLLGEGPRTGLPQTGERATQAGACRSQSAGARGTWHVDSSSARPAAHSGRGKGPAVGYAAVAEAHHAAGVSPARRKPGGPVHPASRAVTQGLLGPDCGRESRSKFSLLKFTECDVRHFNSFTLRCFGGSSRGCVIITPISFQNVSIAQREGLSLSPQAPWATTEPLSVSVDSPVLYIFHKWNHAILGDPQKTRVTFWRAGPLWRRLPQGSVLGARLHCGPAGAVLRGCVRLRGILSWRLNTISHVRTGD